MSDVFDKQDIRILKLLQANANLTTGEIADKTNMSQSPCWRRINRIEQDGLIKKRVAILNRDQLGMEVVVFATVNLSMQGRRQLEEFEQAVKSHPEVVECYTMAGAWDYMLKIVTKNIRHYEDFVRNQLASLPLVSEMHSHIAVTEIKNTTELPLDTQL
ncbi:Lrp/AsnC family transcriptional regulator [bacterium AH-315-K03]|nr:Lrp/AsnC family transcriptional regulator [bacterium AH-315-K03]